MNIRNRIASALTAVALVVAASSANASVIYDWSGTATSGAIGPARAVLTLADTYTPGTAPALTDFVSFFYKNNDGVTVSVPGDDTATGLFGVLPAISGPPLVNFFLNFSAFNSSFGSQTSGDWSSFFADKSVRDLGVSDQNWTLRIPEPGTLALFGLGLAGLGFVRRRKAA